MRTIEEIKARQIEREINEREALLRVVQPAMEANAKKARERNGIREDNITHFHAKLEGFR